MGQYSPRYRNEILKVKEQRLLSGAPSSISLTITGDVRRGRKGYAFGRDNHDDREHSARPSHPHGKSAFRNKQKKGSADCGNHRLTAQAVVARELAARRGQAKMTTADVLFQVRDDPERLARLQSYLRWKDVRRRARIARDTDATEVGTDEDNDYDYGSSSLPLLARLARRDDERTRRMTADEYRAWAECRSAGSFTYRRKRAFVEWCGLGRWSGAGDNHGGDGGDDDVLDALGLLACEGVRTLTERALAVKKREDEEEEGRKRKKRRTGPFVYRSYSYENGGGGDGKEANAPEARAVQPGHIRRAYEILQTPRKQFTAMMNGTRLRSPKKRPGIARDVSADRWRYLA
ncbi:hypothetical protein VTH06DRAFT_4612 [Thermothelomyces fergusii]